jgi:hypothetical protein
MAVRTGVLAVATVLALAAAASAQTRIWFDDVPPWRWAFDSVQKGAEAGIFIGYPLTDRDRAINVVTQVYEAFANAAAPSAQQWAERFLTNLPAGWPEPFQRSRLAGFRLLHVRVEAQADRQIVAFTSVIVLRGPGRPPEIRASLRVEVVKDQEGRWRANYATLADGQPHVFK